jgi:hypothetical protein
VWAVAVGRRLALLLERSRELKPKTPPANVSPRSDSRPDATTGQRDVDREAGFVSGSTRLTRGCGPGDFETAWVWKTARPGELAWTS